MIKMNLQDKALQGKPFLSKPTPGQVALLVALLVILVIALMGCATPPKGYEGRLAALKNRGVDTQLLVRELKVQQDKFALFRSYKRTEEMLANMEAGNFETFSTGNNTFTFSEPVKTQGAACYCPCDCPPGS